MVVIKAPNVYNTAPRPWVFLAGSIEMGAAENWQERVGRLLPNVTILNPRRDDWDSSWVQSIAHPQFRQQVEWELDAMDDTDLVIMYFDPNTKSPITLLELGLLAAKGHPLVVCCPDGYWRKGNVEIVCLRYKVPFVANIDDLVRAARLALLA